MTESRFHGPNITGPKLELQFRTVFGLRSRLSVPYIRRNKGTVFFKAILK